MLKSHTLIDDYEFTEIKYELRPPLDTSGNRVEEIFNAWIWIDNPRQLNSYTTAATKEVILALRQASMDRSVVNVVLTAVGEKAFCTGGNTKEYAEYYSGNPQEYKQYMRLFNDMIEAVLHCDKPVINRVNGMRIAGGQEVGMACDFTISVDTARFGQAGPKHGSAPDGGSTDFLPLYVGFSHAMETCTEKLKQGERDTHSHTERDTQTLRERHTHEKVTHCERVNTRHTNTLRDTHTERKTKSH